MARRKLSEHQKARIASIQDKRRQRMASRVESSLQQAGDADHQPGRVIVRHGQNLLIRGADHQTIHAMFRQNLGDVVCGDNVVWQPTADNEGVVVAVLERDSALSRPDYSGREKAIAANITQIVIVLAPKPAPTGYLLDQYLVAIEQIGVKALICLNKADLLTAQENHAFMDRFAHYQAIGYPLIQVSAKTEHGLDPLLQRLQDNTNILVGQSGVGKSSLINALLPKQGIEEGRLSDTSGLGRHTTSAATLYALDEGGEIIDSPGVRSFRLGDLDRRDLEHGFRELAPYIGQCKFSNCAHQSEPGCAVRAALEARRIHPTRLASFHHMAGKL